jgi:hypothetical protein
MYGYFSTDWKPDDPKWAVDGGDEVDPPAQPIPEEDEDETRADEVTDTP